MADECYFIQLVIISTPTRNENLDIGFTNRSSFINYCQVIPGVSDHEAVLTSFMAQAICHEGSEQNRYLWTRVNLQEMSVELIKFTAWFFELHIVLLH